MRLPCRLERAVGVLEVPWPHGPLLCHVAMSLGCCATPTSKPSCGVSPSEAQTSHGRGIAGHSGHVAVIAQFHHVFVIVLLDPCQCTAVQHAGTVTHGSCTHAGSWNDEHVAAAAKTSLSASSHTSISMDSLPQSLTCTGTGEDRLASILCCIFCIFAEEHPTLNPTKPCFDQGNVSSLYL